MSFERITRKTKEVLENQLFDYNKDRKGASWIHTDWPLANSMRPRISILQISSNLRGLGANTKKRYQEGTMRIYILVDSMAKNLVDQEGKKITAEEAGSQISDEIGKIINHNEEIEGMEGVYFVAWVDEDRDFEGNRRDIQRWLDFTVAMKRG